MRIFISLGKLYCSFFVEQFFDPRSYRDTEKKLEKLPPHWLENDRSQPFFQFCV
jgi:hypothetical protein